MLHLFLFFYLETITDSQEMSKIIGEVYVPFSQFPSMVTSYITMVLYQNQVTDIREYVCLVLCRFVTCVDLSNHCHN